MEKTVLHSAGDAARQWSGVTCPNETGRQMMADLLKIIADFEAVRGAMRFEDEPSDFEAALQACKEQMPKEQAPKEQMS
ncbi:hypothetical protein NON00_05445 [Roseomonas sp. GC11]|uniref:hypothetical protein n=1 Tax=Roseomonas sp. GC11 TaxID=2950546 RepID=UPI00210E59D8|nr:hypothetical protein [Roseomonas sp. GC11]MCQ4159366.1 hypothetical protein [Roseomonas sp. GC11]